MRWLILCLGFLQACGATGNRRLDDGVTPVTPVTRKAPVASKDTRAAEPNTSSAAEPALPATRVSATRTQTGDATIATAAGDEILASELLELWLFRESPRVRAYLEELVLSNLVLAEAHRLEIAIDVALLDRAVEQSLEGLTERLDEESMELDDFIEQRLGLNPEKYRARLRRETEIDLLAERCVRSWLLQSERADVRVIVVEERDQVDEIQAKLEEGEDFALLADQYSIEGSGSDGGRVPPVVRSGVALSRLAFSTSVGDVGGPVLEQGRYLFLRVDARNAPIEGTWEALSTPVEASLAERAIEDPEYWQWKTAMLERYSVDMTPFLEMVGEPVGP